MTTRERYSAPVTDTGRPRRFTRSGISMAAGGVTTLALLLALLLPWLRADVPRGLSWSLAPYSDEGLCNVDARNFAMFGSFHGVGLYRQLTTTSYTAANAFVFLFTGPSIFAARAVSIASVCAMVLIALWGLARPIGTTAAVIVSATLGGCQLLLLYGHIGIIEPFATMLLVAAFVVMIRALAGTRWALGIVAGVLLTLAVTAKGTALLAMPGIVGVPLIGSLLERNRYRRRAALAALAGFVTAVLIWAVAVALPNRNKLRSGTKTLFGAGGGYYPRTVTAARNALWKWLTHPNLADHVMPWTRPQLFAGIAGLVCVAVFWRRCSVVQRYVAASGAVWAGAAWVMLAVSSYHPNRYFVIAVPGLALAAGPGLGVAIAWATARAGRPRWTVAAGTALAFLIAVPGVIGYLKMETPVRGTNELARAQHSIAAVLPDNAVVYGTWGTQVALPHHVRLVVPWAPTKLHMDAPIERYGVQYIIVDVSPSANPTDHAFLAAVSEPGYSLGTPLAVVHWGPHRLALFPILRVPPTVRRDATNTARCANPSRDRAPSCAAA